MLKKYLKVEKNHALWFLKIITKTKGILIDRVFQ
jgi:hypothetical protein